VVSAGAATRVAGLYMFFQKAVRASFVSVVVGGFAHSLGPVARTDRSDVVHDGLA
jgi:hypothetical protein